MKKIYLSLVFVLFCTITVFSQNTITLESSRLDNSLLSISVDDYDFFNLRTPNGVESVLTAGNAVQIMESGMPDLAKLTTNIIVPDRDKMEIKIVSYKYMDYESIDIAPSKGHFDRSIRPEDVPFVYGEAYETDSFWPGKLAQLEDPFIMRDFRGQTVTFFPFQYNPVTKTLRVYTNIVIEVASTGKEGKEPYYRTRENIVLEPEFNKIYNRFFLNMDVAERSYPMLEGEEGSLLIICYDDFMDAMQPFVDWKRTIGRKTEIVPKSEAGANAAAIKSFVEDYYNDNDDFAYLLIVGDGPQIPPMTTSNGHSDNAYGYLVGSNSYNDIFVGRFSAETVAHVETHVQKMIEYERDMTEADTWLSKGIGVARNEGAGGGHHGEADHVHMNFVRDTLLNYTYTEVSQRYDGPGFSTSAALISEDINNGASIINYCNHGSVTGWSVASYSASHVNNLTNVGKLPFIWSVACVNGDFVNNLCFAETWLRATHNGEPTGAVGMMAATINQLWQPPMCGQDEMNSILTEESIVHGNTIKRTFGGLSANGSMFMIPQYGAAGIQTHDTWILFGDPTLMVRTDSPTAFSPIYTPDAMIGWDTFSVSNIDDGATVAITRIDDEGQVEILGTAIASGGDVEIVFDEPLMETETLTLAITGFNKVTYINDNIEVVPAGPYANFTGTPRNILIGESVTFTDLSDPDGGTFSTWEWSFGEGASPETATGQGPHDVVYNTPGTKTVSLLVDGTYERVRENYITVNDIVTLTINISGSGSVEVDGVPYTEPVQLAENSSYSIEAFAEEFWHFSSWSGDFISTDNPANILMDGDKTITANFSEASSGTYTDGDIPTDRGFTGLPGESSCPGTLVVTIPDNATITGIDVEYSMTAQAGGWIADQVSQIRCVSPGGTSEATVFTASGSSGGTHTYSRTNLDIANEVEGGGDIVFELHAGRTYGGSDCSITYNKVDNGTWSITVYYESFQGAYANFVGEPTEILVGETVTFTDTSNPDGGEFSSWQWNFGEGAEPSTASGQGPHTVTYNTSGSKSISLLVDDTYQRIRDNYITVHDIYTLTINTIGEGSVEVNGNPYTETLQLPANSSVNLRAIPEEFHGFNYWEGDLSSSSNPVEIIMDDNKEITAVFVDCSNYSLPFAEDFNASTELPSCWQIVDHVGNGQVWQFGTHTNGLTGTSGNYAYLNSDGYGSGNTQNTDLITPPLNLTIFDDINLQFTHYFVQWTGTSGTLSYSTDDGETWTQIQQWTSTTSNPANFSQTIPELSGQPNVRFKWNYSGTWGFSWNIDDIVITGEQTSGVLNPTNFTANTVSGTQINLSWDQNSDNDNVMVAFNTENTFGSPSGSYNDGDLISGGGTVIYRNSDNSFNHDNLNPATTYYYRAWSYDNSNNYSSGVSTSASTDCGVISLFPYAEDFDGGSSTCWSVESTSTTTWETIQSFMVGGGATTINPVSGSHFFRCQWTDTGVNQDEWLLSPVFDFSGIIEPVLSFWYTGSYHWAVLEDNCELNLMVRINEGEWTPIWSAEDHPEFTSNDINWVWLETIIDLSVYEGIDNIQFAFQYYGFDGAAFAIDDVYINAVESPIIPGDVNGDGIVNVGDVVWLVQYLNGNTPDGFVFENADVNGDGVINILDLTELIDLILAGAKTNTIIDSEPADIYIHEGGIVSFDSDGTVAALQFEIYHPNAMNAELTSHIDNFVSSFYVVENYIRGVLYNLELNPFENSEVQLFEISNIDLSELKWSMAVAASTSHQLVDVNTHNSYAPVSDGSMDKIVSKAMLFPNPNRGNFKIALSLSGCSYVNVMVYDITGKIVHLETDIEYSEGKHSLEFNLSNKLQKGLYFINLTAKNKSNNKTELYFNEKFIVVTNQYEN